LKEILDRVNQLTDLETDRKINDLNLVTDVKILDDGTIQITYCPNSPCSPTAVSLGVSIKNVVQSMGSERKVVVICVGHIMDELVNSLVNKEKNIVR
jgi:metal-sulfur cluster biosynthetic enzyme